MSDFIRPVFQSVTTYEATLTVAEVEAYSKNHAVSFDEAVETLGRAYVAKYSSYCLVGATTLQRADGA